MYHYCQSAVNGLWPALPTGGLRLSLANGSAVILLSAQPGLHHLAGGVRSPSYRQCG
jgi:hypothetical protein